MLEFYLFVNFVARMVVGTERSWETSIDPMDVLALTIRFRGKSEMEGATAAAVTPSMPSLLCLSQFKKLVEFEDFEVSLLESAILLILRLLGLNYSSRLFKGRGGGGGRCLNVDVFDD